ncbi:MAG: sulfatase [Planctomycetota bacterium]
MLSSSLPPFGLFALCVLFSACSSEEPDRRPHVIVISLDTTRADHLGAYEGRAKTPELDALAAEGIVLEDLSTVATTTLASHTSLFTGTYPQTHGVARNGFLVNHANETLAEILETAGYRTAAILGSYALESLFELDQGFQFVDENFDIVLNRGAVFDQSQRRADTVTDAALAWLSTVEDERIFLFAHYFDPHAPHDPPAPYDTMYWDGPRDGFRYTDRAQARRRHMQAGSGVVREMNDILVDGLLREHLTDVHTAPDESERFLASQYAGEVSFMDAEIGRLFDELRERGIWDDAIIVVTGDHGETFWEHGDQWNHGLGVYQTTVHVPGLVKLPAGRAAGVRVAEPVSSIDVLPTVLELAGLTLPAQLEGRSLVAAFGGAPLSARDGFGEATQPRGERIEAGGWANRKKPQYVRSGSLKYVATPYLDLEELYDLATDPGETRNLVSEADAALLDDLRARVEGWRARADPFESIFMPDANPEAMEHLRRLGYLGK